MAINRYDRAAEAPIINTYVPINFDQLYRIGLTQKQAIDEAADQLSTAVQKFGEFRSPSDIDTQRYYDLTLGRQDMRQLINDVVNDPNAMKDAAFLSRLNSAIAGTDYAALSRLEQSREGLLARQKANYQLMLAGGYNPILHDVDYSNYDTLNSGIYNDISPLPYTSVVDMVKPYVDNLKDSFMGVSDGWIHTGVSADRTDAQLRDNWSNIVNTPGYAQNLEIIMKQNPEFSRQQAEELLNSQIIRAGREFTRDQAERDPWELWKMKAQYAASQDSDESTRAKNLTTIVHDDLKHNVRLKIAAMSNLEPEAQQRYIYNGFEGLTKQEQDLLKPYLNQKVMVNYNRQILQDRMNNYGENPWDASRSVALNFSSQIGSVASQLYAKQAAGTEKEFTDGSFEVGDVSRFTPLDEIGMNMAGATQEWKIARDMSGIQEKRRNMLNGVGQRAKIRSVGLTTTDNARAYNIVDMYIPYDYAKKYMTDAEMLNSGGQLVDRSFDETTSAVNKYNYKGNLDGTSVTTRSKTERYLVIPMGSVIPSLGQAANEADALFNKNVGTSSDFRDQQYILSQLGRRSINDGYNF